MFGIIVGCFAAVIGGAIAFGLWSLLPSAWRRARSPIAILAAIGVGVLASRVQPPAPPSTPSSVERVVMASDLWGAASALRSDDPAAFRRAMASGRLLAEHGEDEATVARVRAALFAEAKLKRLEMTNRFHVDRLNLVRDELLELATASPGLCWAVLHGRVEDVTVFPISPALRRRELDLLQRAFEGGGARAQPFDHDTFQANLDKIFVELQATFGEDAVLGPDSPTAAQEQRYCEIAAEYTRLISLSPEPGRMFATAEQMIRGSEQQR